MLIFIIKDIVRMLVAYIQRVSATHALAMASSGVRYFKHFLGLLLREFSTAVISDAVTSAKLVFLGKIRRTSPAAFSTDPFSQL